MKSRWRKWFGQCTVWALSAFALALVGVGYSRGADAAMGMGMGHGMMMHHGGMGHMMGGGSQSSDDSAAAQGSSGSDTEGAKVYASTCSMCHASGAAGAPRFGDHDAWAQRIKQGRKTLYDHALHGYRAMPPKGGRMDLTDSQVESAVDDMVEAAGGWSGGK